MGWGLCSTLMATASSLPALLVARVGLGFFEAGFGPGIPLYLCMCAHFCFFLLASSSYFCYLYYPNAAFYYTKNELGLRMGYCFGFAAVAGAFGGLVAFGVQHIHFHDLFGGAGGGTWRLLFVIEVRFHWFSSSIR